MKKKQIVGIVVAAVVFVCVAAVSLLVNSAIKTGLESFKTTVASAQEALPLQSYVGTVFIEGTIGATANYSRGQVVQGSAVYYVQQYMNDPNNVGIMLYIDSPGGSVYETDEIYLALMEYKQVTGRPVYAWGGSMVASGAYYIASAADSLVVNRNSWVGSIGVYIQITNAAGLLDELGIENEYIKTGDSKAMGSYMEHLTEEQRAIYQGLVDDAFENFLQVVMDGRGYDRETLLEIADGRVYTANQALENGLIDGTGDYADCLQQAMSNCGAVTCFAPAATYSDWFTSLFGRLEALVGKSDIESAMDYLESTNSGEIMYYAG